MGKTVWLALIRPTPVQTAAIHGQRERARAAIASIDRSYPGSGQHRDCGCSESPAGSSGRSRPAYRPSQYLRPGGVVMIRQMLTLRDCKMFALAVLVMVAGTAANGTALQAPEGRKIRVAVVLTEGAVVIDYAGPWEVFSNVHTGSGSMDQQMPFDLYTVGRDRNPIHTAGVMKPGMTVIPYYGFADAPDPDVVVVGAQSGDDQLGPWLRKVHAQHALIMSVCTGAFRLAQAGLLDGKPATTHHASLQRLANQYPHIAVQSSV